MGVGKVPGQTEGAANDRRREPQPCERQTTGTDHTENLSGEFCRILTKRHPEGRGDWEQKQPKLLRTNNLREKIDLRKSYAKLTKP